MIKLEDASILKNSQKVSNIYEQVAVYRINLEGNAPDLFVKIYRTKEGKFFPVPNYWIGAMTPYIFKPYEHDTPENALLEIINRGLDFYDKTANFENLKIQRNNYYYMEETINSHLLKDDV